eukprot:gene6951-7499_t
MKQDKIVVNESHEERLKRRKEELKKKEESLKGIKTIASESNKGEIVELPQFIRVSEEEFVSLSNISDPADLTNTKNDFLQEPKNDSPKDLAEKSDPVQTETLATKQKTPVNLDEVIHSCEKLQRLIKFGRPVISPLIKNNDNNHDPDKDRVTAFRAKLRARVEARRQLVGKTQSNEEHDRHQGRANIPRERRARTVSRERREQQRGLSHERINRLDLGKHYKSGLSFEPGAFSHQDLLAGYSHQAFGIKDSLKPSPMKVANTKQFIQCSICMDSFVDSIANGAICPHHHFICWENCFPNYITSAKCPDSMKSYIDEDGHLTCPDCKIGYDLIDFISNQDSSSIPLKHLKDLLTLQQNYKIEQAIQKVRQEEEAKYEKEKMKLNQMKIEEQEIYLLKTYIIDNILTPHCPSCSFAYIDFDDCFALTCSNKQCNRQFCAWCEQVCKDDEDAHEHVAECKYGNGDVWGDREILEEVRNRIRAEKIQELLKPKSNEVKRTVLDSLSVNFSHINMKVHYVQAASGLEFVLSF